jgi:conjugative relaxase-like TrwC/TraI family protein
VKRPLGDYLCVLSIGKLAAGPGAGRYYVDQVASGREDYYAGEGEAPGRWTGAGSRALGLRGRVGDEELVRLLSGRDPRSGDLLGRELQPGDVAGLDLTFRAPKSVSILFGVADEAISAQIRDGHEAAVAEALAYLEREACIVRRGRAGRIQLPAGGFVAAAFRHRASRAGDPLLHTHVVAANIAQGPDGRWTALFGRALYAHAKTAGYLYQAVLRDELTRRLGLEWRPVEHGVADLQGVRRSTILHFSQRRSEILAVMRERGEHSARAAQIATLDTRRTKQLTLSGDQRAQWRERAAANGLDLVALPELLDRVPAGAGPLTEEGETREPLLGPAGLTERASSFDRRDVLQAVADASPRGATVAELERRADLLLTDERAVGLEGGRWTTFDLLATERELLRGARLRADEPPPQTSLEHSSAAARSRALSDEQTQLVEQVVAGYGGVQVVLAPAGTGKTFALDAAREAWQRAGVPVLGCALSARAACELREQAAIDTTTIAKLRYALDAGARLHDRSVLVVDEAGMVGTRDLAALANAVQDARARLVLVGDDRQLPEIDAGGAFSALARQGPTAHLAEVRRQREAWDRRALAELRTGDLEAFARAYEDRGRIVTRPTATAARQALVDDWASARADGRQALMLAYRRADVADLNDRARAKLRADGRLGPDELTCGGRALAPGDFVLATRNEQRLGVHNGQTGTLTAITDTELHVQLADGRQLRLPHRYAHDGHLDHGYAMTAHRAQGVTVDCTFVLGSDELHREWGYTALSRHRHEARFYRSATPAFLNAPTAALGQTDDPAAEVALALARSRRQHLALTGLDPQDAQRREAAARDHDLARQRQARLEAERDALSPLRFRRRRRVAEDLKRAIADTGRTAAPAKRFAELDDRASRRLLPGRDPLAGLISPSGPHLAPALEPPGRELDTELDLGM